MNRLRVDDEAQRGLERRALGNIAALAHRLGYKDALDIRAERTIVVVLAFAVLVAVVYMVVMVAFQKSPDEARLAWRRCSVAYRAEHTPDARAEARKTYPNSSDPRLVAATEVLLRERIDAACGALP